MQAPVPLWALCNRTYLLLAPYLGVPVRELKRLRDAWHAGADCTKWTRLEEGFVNEPAPPEGKSAVHWGGLDRKSAGQWGSYYGH